MPKNKKVMVTGAAGFIGSHVCEALVQEGAKVKALVRYNSRGDRGNLELLPPQIAQEIEVVHGDIQDAALVAKLVADSDVVLHLAALIGIPYSYVASASYVDINIRGTLNVLQACLRNSTPRLVHTSTSEVYGTAQYTPIDEKHPLQAQSPYSATKIAADKLIESFHRTYNLPVVTIRPFNTYGPRQSSRAVIPTIILQALTDEKISLGNLGPFRDFTFVKDTARSFILAAQCDRAIGEVVNVGSGNGITIIDLAHRISAITGNDLPIMTEEERLRPPSSEVMELLCDSRKARELLGWEPQYSIEEGLAETVEWIRAHLDRFTRGTYAI